MAITTQGVGNAFGLLAIIGLPILILIAIRLSQLAKEGEEDGE